jgi:hypothetical protein
VTTLARYQQPTNLRIVAFLEDVLRQIREVKETQWRLAADLKRVARPAG